MIAIIVSQEKYIVKCLMLGIHIFSRLPFQGPYLFRVKYWLLTENRIMFYIIGNEKKISSEYRDHQVGHLHCHSFCFSQNYIIVKYSFIQLTIKISSPLHSS